MGRLEFWIFNPKIKNDVPIRNETIARIFPVIACMRTGGGALGFFVLAMSLPMDKLTS
jgi:hypothetical protein